MDLLNRELWQTFDQFGTLPGNNLGVIEEDMTVFSGRAVEFHVDKQPTMGWKWNAGWTEKIYQTREYKIGHVISCQQYHYGTYKMIVRLPEFRGSWPAIWMIDISPKMNIPPEIDIFEQFRKDGWLTRYKLACTYHDGPTYENNVTYSKNARSCCPLDQNIVLISFTWTPVAMRWFINKKPIMEIQSKAWINYPIHPMNIVMGAGVGNWKPQDNKLGPFEVVQFSYYQS